MRAVALVSYDRGGSWPDSLTVFDSWDKRWQIGSSLSSSLPDGRLLAVSSQASSWTPGRRCLPAFSTSLERPHVRRDASDPGSSARRQKLPYWTTVGCSACTAVTAAAGIWACLAALDGERWVMGEDVCLSGWAAISGTSPDRSLGEELTPLLSGYATIVLGQNSALIHVLVPRRLHVCHPLAAAGPFPSGHAA